MNQKIIELIESADGFAQVFSDDKYFIVDKLQRGNHIIAMTEYSKRVL